MGKIRFSYDDDIINPRYDNVFKSVFIREIPQSRGALKWLLSAIIGRKLELVAVIAAEPPANDLRDRQIRYDIAVRFDNDQLANIEMTMSPDGYEELRLEYYVSRLYSTQDIKGIDKTYRDLRNTYQISLLSKPRYQDDALVHRFEYYDREHNLPLGGRTSIIVLELPKVERLAARTAAEMTSVERWAAFFWYITNPEKRDLINEILEYEEGIEMASEVLLTVSRDEIERATLEHELKNTLDLQSKMAEAREEGLEQGIATGYQRAREEDEQKERNIIKNFREMGLSFDQIAQGMNSTPQEIEKRHGE